MEKWENMSCSVVFDNGEYTIALRPRNHTHGDEPDMKVWVSQFGREVAQFSDKYRGYGRFANNKDLLPDDVTHKAEKTWKELKDGVYTAEKLQTLRDKFIKRNKSMITKSDSNSWEIIILKLIDDRLHSVMTATAT